MEPVPVPVFRHDFTLDRPFARDVIRGVLHAILFHRVFGPVQARTIDALGMTFPQAVEPSTERLVAEKTEALFRALEAKSCQELSLRFLEKRATRKNWFGTADEEVVWERWDLTFTLTPLPLRATERERAAAIATTQAHLRTFLQHLIDWVTVEQGHVPAIISTEIMPFPVDVVISAPRRD